MSNNPFATEDAWEVGGGFLPAGDHVVEILEVDGTGTSSGGHPQIELKVGNADGEIRDWIVVIPKTVGKVVQLSTAADVERPADEHVKPEGTGYRLAPTWLAQLVGKKVGVIVRDEPNRLDPTAPPRTRVQGYVPAHKIAASDVTPAGGVDPFSPTVVGGHSFPSAAAAASSDDIPF